MTTIDFLEAALAREHRQRDVACCLPGADSASPALVEHILRIQARIDLLDALLIEAQAAGANAKADRDAGPRRPGDPIRHTGFDTEVPRLFHRIGLNPSSISRVIGEVKAQRQALISANEVDPASIYSLVIDDLELLFQQAMSDADIPAEHCARCASRYCLCLDRPR